MANQHPLYELAVRAFSNLSHDPEKRAKYWCESYQTDADNLAAAGIGTEKLEKLGRAWLASMARMASPMIVGPARFPVARMEKLERYRQAHATRYAEYVAACLKPRAERLAPADVLHLARQKLEAAKKRHAELKATPKERRYSFELAYALRDIKNAEARVAVLEQRQALPHIEQHYTGLGLRVEQDPVAQRYRLYFDAKPAPATIVLLKKAGLKWAPSVGAWQRQITPNATYAIMAVIKQLPMSKQFESLKYA